MKHILVFLVALIFCQASAQNTMKIDSGIIWYRGPIVSQKTKTVCTRVDTIWSWGFRPVNIKVMMPIEAEDKYYGTRLGWIKLNLWRAARIMQIDSTFQTETNSAWIVTGAWHTYTWFEDGKKFICERGQFFLSDAAVMKPDTLRLSR